MIRIYFVTLIFLLISWFDATAADYCIVTSNPASGRNINKVVLEEISNEHFYASGDPGYFDYTSYKAHLARGLGSKITLTRGSAYTNMHYAAWIDYNNDKTFSSDEKLNEIIAPVSVTFDLTFTVPAGTQAVSTRIRIRAFYSTNPSQIGDPCSNYPLGETEDYQVIICDFKKITTGLAGGSGKISFFDYDADNDYDLLVHNEYGTPSIKFCQNDAFAYSYKDFLSTPLPHPDNDNLSSDICELNNDNAPDLILTYRYVGTPSESPETVVYQKQTGFTETATGIADLMRGSSAAADFNNDGRQDIVICGQDVNKNPLTYIYENTVDGFVVVNDKLRGIYGKVLATDYDNDDDYDIFICGTDKYGNEISAIYRNDGDWSFTNIQADLYKIAWPNNHSAFGDFNNDGRADLFINDSVYRNDGNDVFTPMTVNYADDYSFNSWNDMDNDGTAELVGQDYNSIIILEYNGTNAFNVSQYIYPPSFGWGIEFATGDYDNDRKQDIIINSSSELCLFKNNVSTNNSVPTPPTSFRAYEGSAGYYTVKLSWGSGSDGTGGTPVAGLSYNLRVGTAVGTNDILSSMSNSVSPYKLLHPGIGNVGYNRSWTLKNLAPGTYYWNVQTVDNSGVASPFSTDQSFTVEPPLTATSIDINGQISAAGAGADFDSDNDIDLLIYSAVTNGDLGIHEQTAAYTYTYHKIRTGYQAVEIKDLNNDNLPDIVGRHNKQSTEIKDSLVLFINKDNFSFQLVKLDSASFSSSASADYDNDGDIDILVYHSGYYLYEKTSSNLYTRKKLELPGGFSKYVTISARDIDNDNAIDLVISGKDNVASLCRTYVFRNDGDLNFVMSQDLMPGLGPTTFSPRSPAITTLPPDIVWTDYNLDGYSDLMITGKDTYGNINNIIYLNNQDGSFSITETSPRPTDKFKTSWIDFNKDGTPDIVMPKPAKLVDNSIYLNYNGTYTPFPNILDGREDAAYIGVLDADNDRDKDIILTYFIYTPPENYEYKTTILKNTFNLAKTLPAAPSLISATVDNFVVHLTWTKGSTNLNGKGNTYNIWVGKSPATADIIAPNSDLSTGFRYIEDAGNVGSNTTWTIKNLPLGTYYWGVQTIDNSLQGGAWSSTGTFEITAITADFSSDIVCQGTGTHFTDNSVATQPITAWNWDFGDGNVSILQNPVFTFSNSGSKSVRLIVTAGELKDTVIKNVTVKAIPLVNFTASDVCQGQLTSFTNNTIADRATITSWQWSFGDGGSSTEEIPTPHGYLNPGDYSVTLIASSINECSGTFQKVVSVGSYPTAAISASGPLKFCRGDSVTLSVPFNLSYSYNWKIDGVSLTGGDSFKYAAKLTGSYVAEVTNPTGGCTTTTSIANITALDTPETPSIRADGLTVFCQGDSVLLKADEISGQLYSWRLNGGTIGENKNMLTARTSGEYSLLVANTSGCFAQSSNKIHVEVNSRPLLPVVSIRGSTIFCEGGDVTFAVTQIAGQKYYWYNDNGPIPGEITNSYTANKSGSYNLEIENISGCKIKTPAVLVTVKKMPDAPVIETANYSPGVCPGDKPVRLSVSNVNATYRYKWYKDLDTLSNYNYSYLEVYDKGSYMIEAALDECSSKSAVVTVDFPDGPSQPVIYAEGPNVWYLACNNTEVSQYTYKWYYNGKLVEGATNYYYIANQKLGQYQVSVANKQGCYTRSAPVRIPLGITGIEDPGINGNILIYPNPGSGIFNLAIENQLTGKLDIRIINFDGRVISSLKDEKTTYYFRKLIDLAGKPKGNYLILINLNGKTAVKKILME